MTIIWHTTGVQSCFIFFINPVCYFLLQILNMISKLLESPLIPVLPKVGDETESSTSKVTIITRMKLLKVFISLLSCAGPSRDGQGARVGHSRGPPVARAPENLSDLTLFVFDHALKCAGKTLLIDGSAHLYTV